MRSTRQRLLNRPSLRAPLIFLSLSCVILGWSKFEGDRILRRREIITDIRESGGQVLESKTARSMGFDFPHEGFSKPHWLKRFIGGEVKPDRPQWVVLSGPAITDDDLVPLKELKDFAASVAA